MAGLIVLALALVARVTADGTVPPRDSGRCLTCHGMANLAVREAPESPLHVLTVMPERFASSVHGRLSCEQCHGEIGPYPHSFPGGRALISCSQDCHAVDSNGQPYSHSATVAAFESSAHRAGTGDPRDKPTCLTCHGGGDPHAITSPHAQTPRARMALCIGCHEDGARMARNHVDPDAVPSYRRSFHYKAIAFGARQAAVCQDCHTTHRVLPASSPASSVAPAALASTCGQTACHPGARVNFAVSGANHLDLRVKREPILRAEEWLFWTLTAGTLSMLVVGIVLDVQKKFGWIELLKKGAARLWRLLDRMSTAGRRTGRAMRWLLLE